MNSQSAQTDSLQNYYDTLFAYLPVITFRPDNRIEDLNEAAEKTLMLSKHKSLGHRFSDTGIKIFDESNRLLNKNEFPWRHALDRAETIDNVTIRFQLPDGTSTWQQCTSMPLFSAKGNTPERALAVMSDVNRHKLSRDKTLQSQKMEAIGSLAGGLAHDFNNVLNNIRATTQLLLVNYDNSTHEFEQLKDIENAVQQGAALTKQLLLFSEPAQEKPQPTMLNQSILQIYRLLKRTMPRNIEINFDLSPEEILVPMNPTRLEQVFLNLTLNARDAMKKGGKLNISTSTLTWDSSNPPPVQNADNGVYACIQLTDTGHGISPDKLQKIFEPYYTSKKEDGGTGLGLSIVYRIMQEAGGHVMAESQVSKGTTMTAFLPTVKSRHGLFRPTAKKMKTKGGNENILIADDEIITTKSTARFLERYGYRTRTAYNGKEALNIFKRYNDEIDLVLLDMEMPILNGQECLKEMLAIKPETRILALSGHLMGKDAWKKKAKGITDFMPKPYDSVELLDTIRNILDH